MTTLDIALIVVLLIFMAVGARLGSLWAGACLIGGFLGAFLSDYYSLPVSEMLGGIPGAGYLAYGLLYGLGVAIALIPGWILSRVSSVLFLGIVDSAVGLLAGALTGILAISLSLIFFLPTFPDLQKKKAWTNSKVIRPAHQSLENLFHKRDLRKPKFDIQARKKAIKKLKAVSNDIIEKIPE